MVRSSWIGPALLLLGLTSTVLGQSVPSSPYSKIPQPGAPSYPPPPSAAMNSAHEHRPPPAEERYVTVREPGRAPQRCRVLEQRARKDGTIVLRVQSLITGEILELSGSAVAPSGPPVLSKTKTMTSAAVPARAPSKAPGWEVPKKLSPKVMGRAEPQTDVQPPPQKKPGAAMDRIPSATSAAGAKSSNTDSKSMPLATTKGKPTGLLKRKPKEMKTAVQPAKGPERSVPVNRTPKVVAKALPQSRQWPPAHSPGPVHGNVASTMPKPMIRNPVASTKTAPPARIITREPKADWQKPMQAKPLVAKSTPRPTKTISPRPTKTISPPPSAKPIVIHSSMQETRRPKSPWQQRPPASAKKPSEHVAKSNAAPSGSEQQTIAQTPKSNNRTMARRTIVEETPVDEERSWKDRVFGVFRSKDSKKSYASMVGGGSKVSRPKVISRDYFKPKNAPKQGVKTPSGRVIAMVNPKALTKRNGTPVARKVEEPQIDPRFRVSKLTEKPGKKSAHSMVVSNSDPKAKDKKPHVGPMLVGPMPEPMQAATTKVERPSGSKVPLKVKSTDWRSSWGKIPSENGSTKVAKTAGASDAAKKFRVTKLTPKSTHAPVAKTKEPSRSGPIRDLVSRFRKTEDQEVTKKPLPAPKPKRTLKDVWQDRTPLISKLPRALKTDDDPLSIPGAFDKGKKIEPKKQEKVSLVPPPPPAPSFPPLPPTPSLPDPPAPGASDEKVVSKAPDKKQETAIVKAKENAVEAPMPGAKPPGAGSVIAAGSPKYVPVPIVTMPDVRRPPVPPTMQSGPPPRAPQLNARVNRRPMPMQGAPSESMANAFTEPGTQRPIPSEPRIGNQAMNSWDAPGVDGRPMPAPMMTNGRPHQGGMPMMQQGYRIPPHAAVAGGPRPSMPPMGPQPNVMARSAYPPNYTYPQGMVQWTPQMQQQMAYWQQMQMQGYQMPQPQMQMQMPMQLPAAAQQAPNQAKGQNVRRLTQMLQESDYPSMREWAADQLSTFNHNQHPEIVASLALAARADPAGTVRMGCVRALEKMGVRSATVIDVIQSLQSDKDVRVRMAAGDALQTLGIMPKSGLRPVKGSE